MCVCRPVETPSRLCNVLLDGAYSARCSAQGPRRRVQGVWIAREAEESDARRDSGGRWRRVNVRGSVAIVTGAANGIGAAISRRLAESGGSVVMNDLDPEALRRSHEMIARRYPEQVAMVVGNCADTSVIRAMVGRAQERYGPVQLYVANAGVGLRSGLDASEQDWQRSIEVNVLAHVRAAEILVPGWLAQGSGHFVSTASAAGLLTQIGSATYSVTKHAAVAFAEWLAVTYGRRGVAVSCLCPMGVDTAMLAVDETTTAAAAQAVAAVAAADVILDPLEVADQVLDALRTRQFLILPHAKVLTFYQRKASDYDRWIAGMQRYQDSLDTRESF